MKKNIGKIEAEKVNPRHRTTCRDCGELPEGRRLKITRGAGKWQKSEVFCRECGREWIRGMAFWLQDLDRHLDK